MKTLQFIKDPTTLVPLADSPPGEAFFRLLDRHGDALAEAVRAARARQPRLRDYRLSMGLVPPLAAIIDPQIRELCAIPFRHREGGVFGCEGVVEGWKGCPPRSPDVAHTVELLRSARALLLLQFDGIRDHHQQKYINRFTRRLGRRLEEIGLSSPGSYGCGPCTMCEKGCDPLEQCRLPDEHTYALESCGFWVNHLCREAAAHPLGRAPEEIRWVTDWNLPSQRPETFMSITGVLIA